MLFLCNVLHAEREQRGTCVIASCCVLHSDEPDNKRQTAALLEEDERPLESETDSMAEYDQMDPSKFNEDGSFIGQYGGKKKDPAENAALSTFV
jgi:hypothetical protein